MKKLLTILFCFALLSVSATNYYIKSTGSDANTGLSDAQAWQTIAKFNSSFAGLSPGDSILFKRGDTFTGTLIISRSGSSGSPIIIGTYGTGAKPIITGFSTVSAWTDLGGGIYESTSAVTTVSTLNMVTFQDTLQPMGRWPKLSSNDNGGYLIIDSHSGNTSITSSDIASALSYVGGELVQRSRIWVIDRGTITNQTSTTVTYTAHVTDNHPGSYSGYDPVNDHGFFFQNHSNACTVLGEWAFNSTTKKIQMYFGGSPASYTIKVANLDSLVSMTSRSYIRFDNIRFIGSNRKTFNIITSNNIQINNCDIEYSGVEGIFVSNSGSNNIQLYNSTISYTNNNAINGNFSSSWTIQNNTINKTGTVRGAGLSDDGQYAAMSFIGASSLIEYNVVKNTGYAGIHFNGASVIVRNNFIDSFCLVKSDGGGIYLFGGGVVATRTIADNIIINGIDDRFGLDLFNRDTDIESEYAGGDATGIYLDGAASYVDITGNTVAMTGYNGIQISGSTNVLCENNTVYDCKAFAMDYRNGTWGSLANLTVKHNILFAKETQSLILDVYSTVANNISSWGTIDSNYYCRPINEPADISIFGWVSNNQGGIIQTDFGDTGILMKSLDEWQTTSSEDPATVKTPRTITNENQLRFEYNATNAAVVVPLPHKYIDARGVVYDGTITLQPYSSAVLIQTAVYYVSNSGSDAAAGTLASPWQTISKVNSSTFFPGDSIVLNKGNQWREQLTLPSSGAVNNRIVFGAYGSGAKPIINGADIETGWTSAGSNQWYINNPNAVTTRAMVVIDNVIYAEQASLAAVNSANEYFIDVSATPDRVYVYSTDDPDLHTVEVSNREYCIVTAAGASSKKYIEIADIELRYAGRAGIYFEGPGSGGGDALNGASYVRRVKAYANRLFGIAHYDHYDSLTVEDCSATYNGNGFYSWVADEGTFRRDTSSNQIYYTVGSSSSDGHGFGGYQSDNWLVENCYSDADHDAIRLDAGGVATDAIIRYNRVFNSRTGTPPTPGMGIGSLGAGATIQIYYNLIVNCAGAGFTLYSESDGTVNFYNNTIFLADGYGTEEGTMYLLYGTGFILKNNIFARMGADGKTLLTVGTNLPTSDYNQWYQGPASAYRWHYNGSNYSTLALWRTGSSQDANSKSGDPLFVNQASDWSLQATSPAINAGVSVGLTQDINGNPIVGTPDIGAFEFQTSNVRNYFLHRGRINWINQ